VIHTATIASELFWFVFYVKRRRCFSYARTGGRSDCCEGPLMSWCRHRLVARPRTPRRAAVSSRLLRVARSLPSLRLRLGLDPSRLPGSRPSLCLSLHAAAASRSALTLLSGPPLADAVSDSAPYAACLAPHAAAKRLQATREEEDGRMRCVKTAFAYFDHLYCGNLKEPDTAER
jgi:hypothetical protein